jgi:AmmeMemoRadiSam system protein B/AmmeMemoRadiSam system protein A
MRHLQLFKAGIIMSTILGQGCFAGERAQGYVRPPAVAGQFYPSDAGHLRLAIQDFIKSAVPPATQKPVGLVVPHAGYIFSGQIGADAFRQAADYRYDVVVILGTNHTAAGFDRISIQATGAYRTPLGNAPVDEEVATELLRSDSDCTSDVEPQKREHSVEVQVPFVQVLFPQARIVPVVIGIPDYRMCTRFGEALAKVLRSRNALIVASSDLSHYPPYNTAVSVDHKTLDAIARLDPKELNSVISKQEHAGTPGVETCACGEAPIMAAATAAKELGATRGVIVSYANSGDTIVGDTSRVVGYGAVVYTTGQVKEEVLAPFAPPPVPAAARPLDAAEKKWLLSLVRETVRRYLTTETVPLPRAFPPQLEYRQGAFVTIKKHGELRGCIGHMAEDMPLARATGLMAMQAAFNDSRFTPVTASELRDLEFEVSVLTPFKPIAGAGEIVIGRDGVVLAKSGRSAVFLPQVATEQRWKTPELLDNLCRKAGLPTDAWKSGAQLYVFQAQVFHEGEH